MAGRERVVLFPFMAQGHIIPFLSLAAVLEERAGFAITVVNTPLNVRALRSALPPSTTIELQELDFNSSNHGLPPDSENTDVLSYDGVLRLFEASVTLKPAFEKLISQISARDGRAPLCIIADFFFGWTVENARNRGIFHSVFIGGGAYGTAVYFSVWLNLPHRSAASETFMVPDLPVPLYLHRSQLSNHCRAADGHDGWSKFIQRQITLTLTTDAFLLNTFEGLESIGVRCLSEKTKTGAVWAIGPVSLMSKAAPPSKRVPDVEVGAVMEWLNQQLPASVLYIAFGSMNAPSASQMAELALGLEVTGVPFVWVMRSPAGRVTDGETEAEGAVAAFERRMKESGQGMVVIGWAPQLEILSHPSTAAFLSHCGWNSTLESLARAIPMIGWPMSAEQYYNSKLLEEEVGVCVEVARGNQSAVRREHIADVIEMVMRETVKRDEMRSKAQKVKALMEAAVAEDGAAAGSSVSALDDFIAAARGRRTL